MDNMDNHFNTLDHQDWKTIVIRKKPINNVANNTNHYLKKIFLKQKYQSRLIMPMK